MFSLRLQGGIPLSEQLEARIAELIIGGEMAENEKLPAVREVAKALTINPNTVQKTSEEFRKAVEDGVKSGLSKEMMTAVIDNVFSEEEKI
ncbi:MAG: GntR family transcriptional regulator [[Eubacterium] siraeum]|nr:GntR family transcriptional regulator [[Eubacterium] siraeum]